MAKTVDLIAIGKLKDHHLISLEQDYLKRLYFPEIKIHELKANAENKEAEGDLITRKIQELGSGYICLLSEWGKVRSSVQFSDWFFQKLETNNRVIFILSGAEGFSESVLKLGNEKLSLSLLTFPHKLARILLIEQLYRAQTIKLGHPYHN